MRICAVVVALLLQPYWSSAEAPELAAASQQLKSYVGNADPSFKWEVREQGSIGACRFARLHLQSQTWQGIPWKHVLYVIKPLEIAPECDSAIMLIGGGSWKPEWGETGPETLKQPNEAVMLATLATAIRSPTIVLLQVPNQPLFENLYEDALIADTFQKFLRNQGDQWPLLMPMVKSAASAMTAVQEFSQEQWQLDLKRFTLTGASKRGWTTWLTSAVDPRVDALAPMVIDMLNMSEQLKHQVTTWGKYSEQIEDYTRLQLPKFIDSPRGQQLQRVVDPYQYRQALVQPKLLIFGTNDRYWPLDACSLYWNDLNGPKYLLYVPNNGHGIKDYSRVVASVAALHRSRNGGEALPELKWEFQADTNGTERLQVQTDKKPNQVLLWQASSPTRDFRDAKWASKVMMADGESGFSASIPKPDTGFAAVFAEVVFPYQPLPASFCTNVKILP